MRRARGAPVIVIMNRYMVLQWTRRLRTGSRLGAAARRLEAREHLDDGPMMDMIALILSSEHLLGVTVGVCSRVFVVPVTHYLAAGTCWVPPACHAC